MTSRRILIVTGAVLLAFAVIATGVVFIALKNRAANLALRPTIVVQTTYAGANAQSVAETVAAPIEQQVNGLEHVLSLSSQSASDGSYVLRIEFEPSTDLDVAQMQVQNRVSLAEPLLPDFVRQQGVIIRKKSLEPLLFVSVTAPDGRYDNLYLGNFADLQLKDELARVSGVGDVVVFGRSGVRMRIIIDNERLAARQLTMAEVIAALRNQNVQVTPETIGSGDQLVLTCRDALRSLDAEQLGSVILKASADDRPVRVMDVASVEFGSTAVSSAKLNGAPVVLLGIQPLSGAKPGELSEAVQDKLTELQAITPEGVSLKIAVNFGPQLERASAKGTAEHLVVDVELPTGVNSDRMLATLDQAAKVAQQSPGVHDVVALTTHPFSLVANQPGLIVVLDPAKQRKLNRDQIAAALRDALAEQVPGVAFHVSAPAAAQGVPLYGYAIEFVVADCAGHGSQQLLQEADALAKQMNASGKFVDAHVAPALRPSPTVKIDIDRARCKALGVSVSDVQAMLQGIPPSAAVEQLQVKNDKNEIVPLGALVRISQVGEPTLIERHNLYPAARLRAHLSPGVSLREAKALCETLAEQELSAPTLKLMWVR
jgi:multidrug efflux pump subunit AcrB